MTTLGGVDAIAFRLSALKILPRIYLLILKWLIYLRINK